MALTVKSIDEITGELADVYDSFIAPKKVWRNNNNKLYLIFRSIAAGQKKLLDSMLALRNRFNPQYCDDADLPGSMLMVGETRIPGKKSILKVVITNGSAEETAVLAAGEYRYASVSGEIFTGALENDVLFAPLAVQAFMLASGHAGAFPVSDIENLKISRSDGKKTDPALSFSCLDNAGSLGREEESLASVRRRILNDSGRQDSIRELELAIKSIASVYECGLMYNAGTEDREYDGVILAPRELLIIITGVPTDELAAEVARYPIYTTHMVTPDKVVYYYNKLLAGGRYPVYYKFHDKTPFYLFVSYKYSSAYLRKEQVEAQIGAAFAKYKNYLTHIDAVLEPMLYEDLAQVNIPAFSVIKIYIQVMQDGELVSVPSVEVPLTRLPELQSITYYAEDTNTEGAK
jgi:hypothetical protein